MRLWHQQLIVILPRAQLLGQHRECCALRGKAWGKKHSTVDYVFQYSPARLYLYHILVIKEMKARGYEPDEKWFDCCYRGKSCPPYSLDFKEEVNKIKKTVKAGDLVSTIYPEHDKRYLDECISNLKEKGAVCRYF